MLCVTGFFFFFCTSIKCHIMASCLQWTDLGRSYLLWTCQIIPESQKQMASLEIGMTRGKEFCILVMLDFRIKVNFHCGVYEIPKRHTLLRCTSIPLDVFLLREKISLLNGSMSSPSPSLYDSIWVGQKVEDNVPTILLFAIQSFYLIFSQVCFVCVGGGICLVCPLAGLGIQ